MSVEKVLDFLNLSGKGGSSKIVPATPLQKSLLYAAKNGDTDSLREIVNRRIGVISKRKAILSDDYPENTTPLVRDSCTSLVFYPLTHYSLPPPTTPYHIHHLSLSLASCC